MESKSDRQPLPPDPPKVSAVQPYEQTVERGFRWLLKALLAWIVLESTLGAAFFFPRKAAALGIGLALAISYLTDLELLRRGRFKAASWSFILATWVAAFVIAIFRGGMGSQYMLLLLAITIVAGWLLGGRSMLLFAGLSLGSTLILAILQTLGFEAPTFFSGRHPLGVWLFSGFSLTTTVVPLKHILGLLRDSVSAIRASEEKYRALVHSLDGIVWEADARTLQFTFVSQSAERILGYPLALWIDDPAFWQHHLYQEDCRQVLHLCGSAGQSLGEFEFQCRMIAADGRIVWLHNKVQVLTQNGVQPTLRGIMMDISRHAQVEAERKKAEEALRENEKELLEAQRVAQVGNWLWEPETDKVLWSIELYRIAGRDPSLPPPAYEEQERLYTPESWARMRRSVTEALRNGTPYRLDLEMIRPDGTTRWIVDRGEALRDEAGRIVRLRGTAQDITERKRAEDSLRLFRALIDQSNDAIEVIDPDTLRLLDVNQRACTDLGYSREELLSMTVCELDPRAESMEVARARAQQDKPIIFESIHRRKDGSTFPVEVGLRFIQLDRLYCLAVVRDITQRKHSEQTLSRQQNTVRGLFQLAKTLTSTMDLSAIFDLLSYQPIQFVNADGAFAGLREEHGFACDSVVHRGISRKMAFTWPNNAGISRWILENKKTFVTNDAANDPLISPEIRQAISPRNLLSAPIFDSDTEVIGFLASYNKQKDDFGAEDVETIEGIAQVASIAIQNALAYRRAQQAEGDLRRLSSRLINSQDEERRRIARELHETTAQDLAALRMSLGRIKRTNAHLPAASKESIDDCLELSNQVIGAVRTLSYLLHPPMLEEAGLQTAVTWYASGFSKRSGISVMVDLPDEVGRLPREYETTLFRIMQECLTNVHTHSGSERARVRIGRKNGFVYMEVQDDGKGISGLSGGESMAAQMGVGIAGMRERVKQFHGTLELDSAPGKGTTVRVILPAKKGAPGKKSN